MIKKHWENKMPNRRREVPDKVYLILETAIDSIFEEIEDDLFRGPLKHMIEREFRFMMRDKFHDYMRNRGKGDK